MPLPSCIRIKAPVTEVEQPQDGWVVPLVEECLTVSKREAETGRVHVSTRTAERLVHVDGTVRKTTVDVKRIPIEQFVDVEPQSREEHVGQRVETVDDTVRHTEVEIDPITPAASKRG